MYVVHESVLYVRAMAQSQRSMCGDVFPGTDHREQTYLLADLCDTLVGGLRPNGRPVEALQYTWDSRTEPQREWIRRCLARRGPRIEQLIEIADEPEPV